MMSFLKLTPEVCRRIWIRHLTEKTIRAWLLSSLLMCLGAAPQPPALPAAPPPASAAVFRQKLAKLKTAKSPRQTPSLDKPMAKIVTVTGRTLIQPSPTNNIAASWNPVATATGYALSASLTNGTTWRGWLTTQTNIALLVPGGFTLNWTVRAYIGTTNKVFSAPSPAVSATTTLPVNTVQLLVTGGRWEVWTVAAANVWFASTTNLAGSNWTKISAVSNTPALFTGALVARQWFALVH